MPGYIIHLAIAEEYLRKHKNIEKKDDFIEGVIFPDSVKDKSETHYGAKSCYSNLFEFLKDKNLNTSFNKGYFLHLLTDYLFYNRYIDHTSKAIYNDYDILNKKLIDEYKIEVPKRINDKIYFKDGKLVILTYEIVYKLIEDISDMDINDIASEVMNDPINWTKMRELKRLD